MKQFLKSSIIILSLLFFGEAIANDYYVPTGSPPTNSALSSATMRNEFALIEDGFDKQPNLAGNGDKPVFVNTAGNAQEAISAASAREKLGLEIGVDVQGVLAEGPFVDGDKTKYDAVPDWPAAVSATEVGYLDGVTGDIQTQIDAAAVNSQAARRNLIINSDFSVNQEGYAANGVASLAAGSYGHDMFRAASTGSLIYTYNGPADITINSFSNSGAGLSGFLQRNDELIAASGREITISFEVVSLDNSLDVYFDNVNLGTVSTVGVKTYTVTANGNGSFYFGHTFAGAGTYTPNFRFKNLKIEYGSTATEYEIPEPRAEELRCFYYYARVSGNAFFTVYFIKAMDKWTFNLPGRMRAGVTASEVGTLSLPGMSSGGDVTGISIPLIGPQLNHIPILLASTISPASDTVGYLSGLATEYIELDARY